MAGGEKSPLEGAVVLLEYCVAGIGTGMFATADSFGVRTVVAPAHLRPGMALTAIEAMLERGARMVLVSFKESVASPFQCTDSSLGRPSGRHRFAMQRRGVQDTLLLRGSLEETLATLGKRTRVHMRAARRRFDRMLPLAALTDASAALASDPDQFCRLNRTSLDPIDQRDFDHQVRSVSGEQDSFVLGLQQGERWLALVAGWRQGDTTWVEWQMNAAGYEKLSLGSVMRSYVLEHEISIGMRQVSFHGGTSHSMAHSFVKDDVIDLLGRRSGWANSALIAMGRRLCTLFPHLRQRGNFLLDALSADSLTLAEKIHCGPEV